MNNQARATSHIPVLYGEALEGLAVHSGADYCDCTVGNGGHAAGILERSAPGGRLLGLDADPEALIVARAALAAFGARAVLAQANFAGLAEAATAHGFRSFAGILFDLGLSSRQLSAQGRGFSFQQDAPLDMRLDPGQTTAAADLVNNLAERELADLIYAYGEERQSRQIARAIVAARPISSTRQLATLIEQAIGRRGKIHPATKTFQALRMAVNEDVHSLEAALPQATALLWPGGRLAVISFHSGEDRIVKEFMRRESRDCICPPELPDCRCGHKATLRILTKHVITARYEETKQNPRSRSAKLRIAEKLAE